MDAEKAGIAADKPENQPKSPGHLREASVAFEKNAQDADQ